MKIQRFTSLHNFKKIAVQFVLAAAFCCLSTSGAFADTHTTSINDAQSDPINTDRPDFTESTTVVSPGTIQLETGYTFSRQNTQRDHTIGEALIRGAIDEKTEWRLGLNSYVVTRDPNGVSTSGKDDIMLAFKRSLSKGSGTTGFGKPEISIIGLTMVPSGARAYREKWQPGVKLLFGWDLTDKTSLSSNLNYIYASDQGQRFHQFQASLSLGHSLTKRLGTFLEIYGSFPADSTDQNGKYIDGGFTYLLNNDLQLDIRAGNGLHNNAGPDYFVGAGVSHRF